METTRLRWFLTLAEKSSIREAAALLKVTPGALSKATADLESQLGRPLFVRSSRGLVLTEAGRYFQRRARELVRIEDEIREELSGTATPKRIAVAGTEPLLLLHFSAVLRLARARFPGVVLELRVVRDDDEAHRALEDDASCLAVLAETSRARASRALAPAKFGTFVGGKHPFVRRAGSGIPVEEVITHSFVVPARAVFGPMVDGASLDGWRDDVFPRKHRVAAPTMALVQAYVETGEAIAYLPVGLAKGMDATKVTVTGCEYSCEVAAHLTRSSSAPGWLRQLL